MGQRSQSSRIDLTTEEVDAFLATEPTPEQVDTWWQTNRDRIASFADARRVIDQVFGSRQ